MFYKEQGFQVIDKNVVDSIKIDRINSILEFNLTETFDFSESEIIITYGSVAAFPLDPDNDYLLDEYLMSLVSGSFAKYETRNLVFRGYVIPDRSGSFNPNAGMFIDGPRFAGDFFYVDNLIAPPNKKVVVTGSATGNNTFHNIYARIDSLYLDTVNVDLELVV